MSGEQSYRRLPGRAGLFIRHSLWMAPDHLLRVRAHPFGQEYRRYYFKDIQALVMTELVNPTAYFLYGFAALFALLSFLLFSIQHQVWGTLSAFPAIILFYWGWRTPDCACRIQTRVSTDRLPSLGKFRSARRAIAVVQTDVERVQGALDPGKLQSQAANVTAPRTTDIPELRHARGSAHWVLFALMLLRGIQILAALGFAIKSVAYGLVGDAVGAAVVLTAIFAALEQRRTALTRSVKWIVYGTLIWQALSFVVALGFGGYVGLQMALKRYGPLTNIESATRLYQFVNAAAYLLLAIAGMILLWRHQRVIHDPPRLVPEPVTTTTDHQ